jgi:hypothetical protein
MTSLTRGPLPARVYWVRRILVLGTALLLVLAIARVLTGGSDASSAAGAAAQVAADPTPTSTSVTPTATPTRKQQQPGKGKTSHAPVLAQPDGPCSDEDIAVEPDVRKPVAGQDVTIVLRLRTLSADACTWRVSHDSLTLKISSGQDEVWSSRECPRAIPRSTVVVRKAVSTTVEVTWNSRRSDDTCSRLTEWAMPGYYHVVAAALAGEPADVQFQLDAPTSQQITRSPSPSAHGHKSSDRPSGRPVPSGSATTD